MHDTSVCLWHSRIDSWLYFGRINVNWNWFQLVRVLLSHESSMPAQIDMLRAMNRLKSRFMLIDWEMRIYCKGSIKSRFMALVNALRVRHWLRIEPTLIIAKECVNDLFMLYRATVEVDGRCVSRSWTQWPLLVQVLRGHITYSSSWSWVCLIQSIILSLESYALTVALAMVSRERDGSGWAGCWLHYDILDRDSWLYIKSILGVIAGSTEHLNSMNLSQLHCFLSPINILKGFTITSV